MVAAGYRCWDLFEPSVFLYGINLGNRKRVTAVTADYDRISLVNDAGVSLARLWLPAEKANFLVFYLVSDVLCLGLDC